MSTPASVPPNPSTAAAASPAPSSPAATPAAVASATPTFQGRWKYAVGLLALGVVAQLALWAYFADDPTFSHMSVLFVWPAIVFALFIWWTWFSGWSWRVRQVGLGVVASAVAVFFAVFQIDGSDGNMRPILSYRWEPSRAARNAAFLRNQTVASPATEVAASGTEARPATPAVTVTLTEDDWPGYRGPGRDGVVRGRGFRTDWDRRPPQELWRQPVGLGWSSFAIAGDLAITMEQREQSETTTAYDLRTGRLIWKFADDVRLEIIVINGGDGPRSTPQIAGERTITLGGTGRLNCLDTRTGQKLWSREILADASNSEKPVANIEWGVSLAPLIVDDLVIVVPGGEQGKSVIAYDLATGSIRWTSGDFVATYGGPRIETFLGVRQLLVLHGTGLASLEPANGQILWDFPWGNAPKVNSAQPIKIDDQTLVLGCGYAVGATQIALVEKQGVWSATGGWKSNKFKLKFNDAVLHDGHLYGLDDGILTCLDAATGKTRWKGGRYGYGQLLLQGDTLLVVTEAGELCLVAAQPTKFEERARIKALEGTTWNHPALAHGVLLVRNGSEAVAFDVAP